MDESLISVIVPIYKVEPYIRRCVESVLGQTHRHIEVILVDDGSPDNCGAICDEYARNDDRIFVIHKKNGGLSSARNAALDIASGEYLMFVDGDDWVEPEFCATALKHALDNKAQVVSFGFNRLFVGKDGTLKGKKRETTPPRSCIMDASEAVRHLILTDYPMYNYVWNKLFNRSFWGNVRFPDGKLFEDQAVTYQIVMKAGWVYVSDAVLYNYVQRPENITNAMSDCPRSIIDRFDIWKDWLPAIRYSCPENECFQIVRMASLAVSAFVFIPPKGEYREALDEMKAFLDTHRDSVLHGSPNRWIAIKLWLYYHCPSMLLLWKHVRTAFHLLSKNY